MRLISKNHALLSLIFFALYWLKGWWVEYFENDVFSQPDFVFFHLNPKIDRFGYWLMNDISLGMAGMIISDKVITRSYSSEIQRIIFHVIQSIWMAEIIDVLLVQLYHSGKSYNSIFTIMLGLVIFTLKMIAYVRQINR
jgi:hypothetical protein